MSAVLREALFQAIADIVALEEQNRILAETLAKALKLLVDKNVVVTDEIALWLRIAAGDSKDSPSSNGTIDKEG
jgi:hypothetical protein